MLAPIIPLANQEILSEYEEVLTRNKFGFDEAKVRKMLDDISRRAVFLGRTPSAELFADPDDAVFYEVVMTARYVADAYSVTGNLRHFPVKPYVVAPREMLEIVRQGQSEAREQKQNRS